LTAPVVPELPRKRRERLAAVVVPLDLGRKVDATASAANAMVQLIVFVPVDGLIKKANPLDRLAPKGARMDALDLAGLGRLLKRSGPSKRTAHRKGDRPSPETEASAAHRAADIVRSAGFQRADAGADVVRVDNRLPINPDD